MTTLGVLYPGFAAEDDYASAAARLTEPADVIVIHTRVDEDTNTIEDARRTGEVERLVDAVHDLRRQCATLHRRADAVLWACTAGSFVFGLEGARDQARQVAASAGVPVTSASLAFAEAVWHLGIRRVAVAATYPDEEAVLFGAFMAEVGVEVLAITSAGVPEGPGGAALSPDEAIGFAVGADRARAEAILVPDTAIRSTALLDRLEAAAGKPVLTANQVTLWSGLRAAGAFRPQDGLGSLFRTAAPVRASQ